MQSGERLYPEKLHVYECLGARLPRSEPDVEGYLGLWPEAPYFYLFFDRCARADVEGWLQGQDGWALRDTYEIDYDHWQQLSNLDQRIGPFMVKAADCRSGTASSPMRCAPSAVEVEPYGGGSYSAIPLLLDPGLVFGSGLHPTTRGCLLTIAGLFRDEPVRTVVDFGTGTGILAVACGLLGASRVCAIDCVPLAIRVAKDNARLNGLEGKVELLVAQDLSVLGKPSDLLLMNIEWPCLQQALRSTEWLDYRWVVLSGFLDSQWKDLQRLLPAKGKSCRYEALDGWGTVLLSFA